MADYSDFVTKRDLEEFQQWIQQQLEKAIKQEIKEYYNSSQFRKDFMEGVGPIETDENT